MQSCTGAPPVTVLVTDTCKDCSATQINLNAATFEAALSTKTGIIGVSWRQVNAILSSVDQDLLGLPI